MKRFHEDIDLSFTNHFILSQIYEDGTIEQPFLTRN